MTDSTRTEHDSLGPVEVPADRLWGAQTERSRNNFAISNERMPRELIIALVEVKKAAAGVNAELGLLEQATAHAITRAADEVLEGRHDGEFPLSVWQTGSGTQTNMNVNEVLANRASELLGGARGKDRLVHPNDDVNRGQSSNDVFPTAMAIASARALAKNVVPSAARLAASLEARSALFAEVVKIGRTHLQDATPITVEQEMSGWVAQLRRATKQLDAAIPGVGELAIGGTAVGTGLNTHPEFAERMTARLVEMTGLPLSNGKNKFELIAAHDALVAAHGALKALAVALTKIANDIRWLASGPRAGIGELVIPENEPGSSIMPGKVNPTQAEAVTMLAAQVMGNDVVVGIAGAGGAFQLNAFKPVIAHAFLQSARLLSDGCDSFRQHCAEGIDVQRTRIAEHLGQSLMLVTALAPHIGYDAAARIAKKAHAEGTTLREAATQLGLVSEDDFDAWVVPESMVSPRSAASGSSSDQASASSAPKRKA